jgi:photosystem II stability/assembly factor-like uncharacterized protein
LIILEVLIIMNFLFAYIFLCTFCASASSPEFLHEKTYQAPLILPVESIAFNGIEGAWLATGTGNLVYTTNGGATWNRIDNNVIGGFKSVSFISSKRGWAINGNAQVWHTVDSGKSWILLAKLDYSHSRFIGPVNQIYFLDESYGWIVDAFSIWCTRDGGVSWQRSLPTLIGDGVNVSIDRCYFVNRDVGWLTGANGLIYLTNDGGKTWAEKRITPVGIDINDIFFIDSRSGWLCTRPTGTVYQTVDGGGTWQLQSSEKGFRIYTVHFVSNSEGWGIGIEENRQESRNGPARALILHTSDGGKSWQSVNTTDDRLPFHIFFGDREHGWAIMQGRIYRTIDGGKTWLLRLSL